MRGLGLLVLGLGLGLGAGYLTTDTWGSPALVWLALGLVVLSSLLLALGARRAVELIPSATGPEREAAGPAKPALAGLGRRVEQILESAEAQAAEKIRSAEEEAERIVAAARRRAGQPPD
jgi:hypothetical protein